LCRQLRQALGDSPQVLRDLSVSLDSVGGAESQAGHGEAALAAYRESLGLGRQLQQALGDSPQVLRDLSVSLEKLGDGERQAGRGEAALAAYRESLALRRQLQQALGDSPQVLDDLATGLERIATSKVADMPERQSATSEVLTLRQHLMAAHPGSAWHTQRLVTAQRIASQPAPGAVPDNS
jgi:tetratricopeptide (TPR) repeat protein